MRQIKFRGQLFISGEWFYGHLFTDNDESALISQAHQIQSLSHVEFSNSFREVRPETVGQFTGLLDKNGAEIYEGDIVMWGHANDYSREIPHRQAVVKLFPALHFETFTKTEFGTPHEFHYGNFSYKDTHRHLEIIGNIHSSPELLKNE